MRMRRPRSNSKYGNIKVEYDGQKFDSQKEAYRWCELQLLQKAGEISELQRQVKFELQPAFYHAGHKLRPIIYVCDFFYKEKDKYIIEDVKSPATKNNGVYKLKKKMMLYRGYEIREM
jgi:hypothetical protein